MSKIIVGVDRSEGSNDAITLASGLAGITGAELMLVNVYPYDQRPSRAMNAAFEAHLLQDSHALLERLRTKLGDESVEIKAVANPSPAHGLHEVAEAEDGSLIVVGSTHTGRAGRVLPGSTAERLLHGAPCPVAVAPKGYSGRPGQEPGIIGCAYDGSQSAHRALDAAHLIAAATGSRLRAIRAFQPLAYDIPPGGSVSAGGIGSYNDSLQERVSDELNAAVAKLDGDPRGEAFFAVGDAGKILVEQSGQLDLLLVGSRGYGPLHSVLIGGVAGRVVREAACPVLVLPRKARHVGEDSLFAEAAGVTG